MLILSFCPGLSFSCSSELFLSLSCRFFCLLLPFAVFYLLGDLLKLFLAFFVLLAVLHEVMNLNLKLYAFVVNGLIKGEIEKPSCPFLDLIVMSH
jgi:hypothetical protein